MADRPFAGAEQALGRAAQAAGQSSIAPAQALAALSSGGGRRGVQIPPIPAGGGRAELGRGIGMGIGALGQGIGAGLQEMAAERKARAAEGRAATRDVLQAAEAQRVKGIAAYQYNQLGLAQQALGEMDAFRQLEVQEVTDQLKVLNEYGDNPNHPKWRDNPVIAGYGGYIGGGEDELMEMSLEGKLDLVADIEDLTARRMWLTRGGPWIEAVLALGIPDLMERLREGIPPSREYIDLYLGDRVSDIQKDQLHHATVELAKVKGDQTMLDEEFLDSWRDKIQGEFEALTMSDHWLRKTARVEKNVGAAVALQQLRQGYQGYRLQVANVMTKYHQFLDSSGLELNEEGETISDAGVRVRVEGMPKYVLQSHYTDAAPEERLSLAIMQLGGETPLINLIRNASTHRKDRELIDQIARGENPENIPFDPSQVGAADRLIGYWTDKLYDEVDILKGMSPEALTEAGYTSKTARVARRRMTRVIEDLTEARGVLKSVTSVKIREIRALDGKLQELFSPENWQKMASGLSPSEVLFGQLLTSYKDSLAAKLLTREVTAEEVSRAGGFPPLPTQEERRGEIRQRISRERLLEAPPSNWLPNQPQKRRLELWKTMGKGDKTETWDEFMEEQKAVGG